MKKYIQLLTISIVSINTFLMLGCGDSSNNSISAQRMTDAMYAVMEADRATYTQNVVHRLQNIDKVIDAKEHWEDEKALPLPAQMFRMGAERASENMHGISYALLSLWPVNKQNKPKTDIEREGLKFVADNIGKNFYSNETLGDKTYFTAVYADTAVSQACISCHNDHIDSPRDDFKLDEVMGGVVIRIEMN